MKVGLGCQRISIILIFQLFGDILETVDFTGLARDYLADIKRLSGILFVIVGRCGFEVRTIEIQGTAALMATLK